MNIEFAMEKGSRESQLDNFLIFYYSNKYYFLIADGFDNSCIEKIFSSLNKIAELWIKNGDNIFKENNLNVAIEDNIKMSFLAASIDNYKLSFFSLGDCRIYSNKILLSSDDSMAWKALIKRKNQKDTAALTTIHPMRHTLTKCVGGGRSLSFEYGEHSIKEGEKVILCTDGAWSIFHKTITDGEFSTEMIIDGTIDNSLAVEIVV